MIVKNEETVLEVPTNSWLFVLVNTPDRRGALVNISLDKVWRLSTREL